MEKKNNIKKNKNNKVNKAKKVTKPVAVLDLTDLNSIEDFYTRVDKFCIENNLEIVMPNNAAVVEVIEEKKPSYLTRLWNAIKKFFTR